MGNSTDGDAAVRHRRIGRRRQVDADRSAALRLEVDLRGPARGGRAHQRADRGDEYTNLALLTDGLRAEREQGITIDVAYRYFATPKRKFIIADTPGHIQYTRNMVTGASTADLALVLIDARKGVLEQSPPPRLPRLAAAHPAPRAVRQQDGPRRLRPRSVFERDQGRVPRVRHEARRHRPHLHPDLRAPRRQRRQPLGEHAVVRGLLAAAPPRRGAHRVGPQPHRRPLPGAVRDAVPRADATTTTAATPARWPAACSSRATRSSCCRRASPSTDRPHRHRRRPGRRGVRADVGRPSRSTDDIDISRGDMICRPHNQPDGRPGHRRDGLLDDRAGSSLTPGAKLRHQAHDPDGPGAGQGPAVPARRQHAAPRRGGRPRWRSTRSVGSALRTTQPLFFDEYRRNRDDRQLHPHRRGDQHHRRPPG